MTLRDMFLNLLVVLSNQFYEVTEIPGGFGLHRIFGELAL